MAAYPLALQYLPYSPLNPDSFGNSVAIGSFMQGIEIWDLDVLDAVEPVVNLGGILGKKGRSKAKKSKVKLAKNSHKDSVLTIHKHPTRHNFLASGSADNTIKVWDVVTQKCLLTHNIHDDKV